MIFGSNYWLCSRKVTENRNVFGRKYYDFYILSATSTHRLLNYGGSNGDGKGVYNGGTFNYGIRPVFILKSDKSISVSR